MYLIKSYHLNISGDDETRIKKTVWPNGRECHSFILLYIIFKTMIFILRSCNLTLLKWKRNNNNLLFIYWVSTEGRKEWEIKSQSREWLCLFRFVVNVVVYKVWLMPIAKSQLLRNKCNCCCCLRYKEMCQSHVCLWFDLHPAKPHTLLHTHGQHTQWPCHWTL